MYLAVSDAHMRQTTGTKSGYKLGQACLKMPYRDCEVSIAFDDSCGCMADLARVDLRVYYQDVDVTDLIKPAKQHAMHPHNLLDLLWVKKRIDRAFRLGLLQAVQPGKRRKAVQG